MGQITGIGLDFEKPKGTSANKERAGRSPFFPARSGKLLNYPAQVFPDNNHPGRLIATRVSFHLGPAPAKPRTQTLWDTRSNSCHGALGRMTPTPFDSLPTRTLDFQGRVGLSSRRPRIFGTEDVLPAAPESLHL